MFDWSFSGRNDGTGFGGSIELTWIEDGERERLNNTARVGAPGAHIASTATPTDQVFDIRWAVEGKREVPVEGETMLTAVTTGLAPWDDDGAFHPAVGLNVQCESGVVLEVAMTSSHVFAFKSQGLRGGAGASLGLPPDGSVGVHANVDDQHEIDIPTPTALVEIRETPRRGDALAKQGRLTLDHPAGTETRTFGSDPIQPIDLEGGPGSYELTVDRVTLGPSSLNGFIVGLEPIQLPSPQTPAALDRS